MMQFSKYSKTGLLNSRCYKQDACSWNISRNDVIISRHVNKCDVLRISQRSTVRESLISQIH